MHSGKNICPTLISAAAALQSHVPSKYRESKTRPAAEVRRCCCSKSAAKALMTSHFILIGQILWWQARGVLSVYSNNSIPILLTNLCFYDSKSLFSVHRTVILSNFLSKTLIKAHIPTLYWCLNSICLCWGPSPESNRFRIVEERIAMHWRIDLFSHP